MVRCTTVQRPALDTSDVGHDLQLGVEGGTAVAAEPMLVDLAGIAYSVIVFGCAFGDIEVATRDDYVGGVGCAGPVVG